MAGNGKSEVPSFGRSELADFEKASSLEWLEPNGLGGWASSTVGDAHSRRYHGLLVAATKPPAGREVLLSKLAATLVFASGERVELDANRYPGAIHPRGFELLESFSLEPFPVSTWAGKGFRTRRTTGAIAGENTTVLLFERLASRSEGVAPSGPPGAPPARSPASSDESVLTLELRPLFAGRDIHALGHTDSKREWRAEGTSAPCASFSRPGDEEAAVHVDIAGASFEADPFWFYDLEYSEERERGFDFREDLHSPGVFRVPFAIGRPIGVVISTERRSGREAKALLDAERARRNRLVALAGGSPGTTHRLESALVRAADAFLVRRSPSEAASAALASPAAVGADLPGWSVIAGYPWFADWGRDAMIALPGLCLETGRFVEAREILRGFAAASSQGMLPNRFPEGGEPPEYNTVDAALWMFVAASRYAEATGDDDFVRDEMLPALDETLAWYGRGTRYGIRVTGDGLLSAGEPGIQLTWMDARVGERVITPRHGEPVEIEALWANALAIAAALHRRFGNAKRAASLAALAKAVKRRFEERFWNPAKGELFDVMPAPGGAPDATTRPNQLYALALPHALLPRAKALAVLDAVERKLVTPRGLRSLASDEPGYVGRYEGGPDVRDAAYHQGTVWAFLGGIWVDALVRYRGAKGQKEARAWLAGFAPHLDEAGLGTVSEIFDGDTPHAPRGAIAQAWSVAELLRACRRASVRSRR